MQTETLRMPRVFIIGGFLAIQFTEAFVEIRSVFKGWTLSDRTMLRAPTSLTFRCDAFGGDYGLGNAKGPDPATTQHGGGKILR